MKNIQTNKNISFYTKNFYKRNNIYFNLGLNNRKLKFLLKKKHIIKLNNIKNIKDKEILLYEPLKFHIFNFKISNYKNYKNTQGLPSRGQRTHTNAKTKKKFKIQIDPEVTKSF